MTYGLVSMCPVTAIFLDMRDHTEIGIVSVLIALCIMTIIVTRIFCICGQAMIGAMDASLKQQEQKRRSSITEKASNNVANVTNGGVQDSINVSQGDQNLLVARTKVKRVIALTVFLGVGFECLLLFDVCSGYGVAVPLLMFVGPLVLCFPIWIGINIHVHAGRSKAWEGKSSRQQLLSNGGATTGWASKLPEKSRLGNPFSGCKQSLVVPTEVPMMTPC